MKRCLLATLLAVTVSPPVRPQDANIDRPQAAMPSVAELLERVRATFPDAVWFVRGELFMRDVRGEPVRTMEMTLQLDLRGHPPSARLHLADAFGMVLAAVEASLGMDGALLLRDITSDPSAPRVLPSNAEVLDTGLQWADFLFDFLWWSRGRVIGLEMKRARECWVADIHAPPGGRYATVRVWVDAREHLLLQAEGRDASGRVIRRLSVRSVTKVNERWVVEDLDLETPPRSDRITFRVRESRALPRDAQQ